MDESKKPIVLVDLTAALDATAGIPQSARQTAWLLSQSPSVTTAVLVLSLHYRSRASLYGRKRRYSQAVGEDAEYLASLIDSGRKRPWTPLDLWEEIGRFLGRSYPIIPFAPKNWEEIFWEHYFAPGFPSAFRMELEKIPFHRSPLTRPEATLALRRGGPVVRLDTRGFGLVIFQNPTPIRVSAGTVKVVRCHDLVPLLRFDTQPQDLHVIRDYRMALAQCVHDGSHFACVSEATREVLLDLYPKIRDRASVIPNSIPVSEWMTAEQPISETPHPFFLAVGTIEPRKNYLRLLLGFRTYLKSRPAVARLVLVGSRGWRNEEEVIEIEKALEEGWLIWHERVEPQTLIDLYRSAYALVGASVDEGFGMPPLEAAVLGTPSVLSDLPVFRAHLEGAAEYFDPYDTDSLAAALARLTSERRAALVPQARSHAQRFSPANERAQWEGLINRVIGRSSGKS